MKVGLLYISALHSIHHMNIARTRLVLNLVLLL
jgi:hypothetical protein